jgi:ammonium transporter, Amt family
MDTGDTAWVLVSSALVMFMTPGLALFYGGMVRAKNVLGTLMHSVFALGLVSVLWVLVAYTLAFGDSQGGLIGGFEFAGFADVGAEPNELFSTTIPHVLFATFQLMFAIITPALITGAFAERIKFWAYVLFTGLWLLLVYAPIAHWVFHPDGWLRKLGALDFAGGTVVHINAGIAALAAVLVIGKRRGFGKEAFVPHNLTLTVLGTGILWFGWFGFNAGSALGANALAATAFIATNLGAAAGACGWALVDSLKGGKATTLGVASGAVAGLVAITPAAGFVGPMGALAIGLAGGMLCAYAVRLKFKLGYDDALDVVGVHLVGGIAGSLLLGIFADLSYNEFGRDGLLAGGGLGLLGDQLLAVVATLAYSFVVSYGLLKLIDVVVGARVTEDDEVAGLDVAQHSEAGYAFAEGGGLTMATSTPAHGGALTMSAAPSAPTGSPATQGGEAR